MICRIRLINRILRRWEPMCEGSIGAYPSEFLSVRRTENQKKRIRRFGATSMLNMTQPPTPTGGLLNLSTHLCRWAWTCCHTLWTIQLRTTHVYHANTRGQQHPNKLIYIYVAGLLPYHQRGQDQMYIPAVVGQVKKLMEVENRDGKVKPNVRVPRHATMISRKETKFIPHHHVSEKSSLSTITAVSTHVILVESFRPGNSIPHKCTHFRPGNEQCLNLILRQL